jgi:hypothetical protein
LEQLWRCFQKRDIFQREEEINVMETDKLGVSAWKSARIRLAVLGLLQALCLGHSQAQDAGSRPFDDEMAKQQKIYSSKGTNVPDGYVTYRSLANYEELLPPGFSNRLRRAGPSDRWLDIGAGGGHAILDYYAPEYDAALGKQPARPGSKAHAVAVSIEDRRTERWWQSELIAGHPIRYLFSKPLRDYSREELGRFQIITDVYGGFSYTNDLSLFMEKVLGLLEVNGDFYSLLQSVRLENGRGRTDIWFLTELVDDAGRDLNVCSWLKRISCAQVACDSKSGWDQPTELIHVRKVCDAVAVPPLRPVHFEAGNPPGRKFELSRLPAGPAVGPVSPAIAPAPADPVAGNR